MITGIIFWLLVAFLAFQIAIRLHLIWKVLTDDWSDFDDTHNQS